MHAAAGPPATAMSPAQRPGRSGRQRLRARGPLRDPSVGEQLVVARVSVPHTGANRKVDSRRKSGDGGTPCRGTRWWRSATPTDQALNGSGNIAGRHTGSEKCMSSVLPMPAKSKRTSCGSVYAISIMPRVAAYSNRNPTDSTLKDVPVMIAVVSKAAVAAPGRRSLRRTAPRRVSDRQWRDVL